MLLYDAFFVFIQPRLTKSPSVMVEVDPPSLFNCGWLTKSPSIMVEIHPPTLSDCGCHTRTKSPSIMSVAPQCSRA